MLPRDRQIKFDDRCAASDDALHVGLSFKPAVLRRRTVIMIALGGIAAIIYGTLVPFNFTRGHGLLWQLRLHAPQGGDFTSNILVYVPMGIFLRLLFRRRGSRWWTECAASLAVAGGISYGTEVLQSLLPSRVPSLTDTLCNLAGAVVGITLAPAFQRHLRQSHAWLYASLRTRPFAVAAGLTSLCIGLYALAPFDVQPTPTYVSGAIARLQASWHAGLSGGYRLGTTDLAAKALGAAAYGVLALLLVMARREEDRPLIACAVHALSRAAALAAVLEGVQLFTISHAADWRDFELALLCSAVGIVVGVLLLWRRPLIHRDPAALVAPMLPVMTVAFAVWAFAVTVQTVSGGQAGSMHWLPIMANFSRSWNSLVTGYAAGFLNYTLAAALVVVWYRARRRVPGLAMCILVAALAALSLQVIAALALGSAFDTGHLIVAFVAGGTAHRMDRAICGRAHRVQPAEHHSPPRNG